MHVCHDEKTKKEEEEKKKGGKKEERTKTEHEGSVISDSDSFSRYFASGEKVSLWMIIRTKVKARKGFF